MLTTNSHYIRPRLWVGNVGLTGYGLSEHLRYLQAAPFPEGTGAVVIQPGIEEVQRFLEGDYSDPPHPRPNPYEMQWEHAPLQTRFPLWHCSRILQEISSIKSLDRTSALITPASPPAM